MALKSAWPSTFRRCPRPRRSPIFSKPTRLTRRSFTSGNAHHAITGTGGPTHRRRLELPAARPESRNTSRTSPKRFGVRRWECSARRIRYDRNEMRELDAWIAENLFGGIHHQEKPYREGIDTSLLAMWQGEMDCLVSGWRPTTEPASAMLVLEKCRCVDGVHLSPPSPDKICEIWGGGVRAYADTLPLAVCLFAKQLFSK